MAFYSSSYYETDDHGEYYLTPYADDLSAPLQPDQGPTVSYSSYEPSFQNFLEYNPTPYFHAFHSYSASPSCSKPISIEYNPKFYEQSYDTQFLISYSVSEFNEPGFEEYDPTPYDGGFDLAQVYGKPLSPSDETCYPLNGGSVSVTPLGGNKEQINEQAAKPINGSQPIQAIEEEQKQHQESREDQPIQESTDQGKPDHQVEEVEESKGSDHEHNLGSVSHGYEKQAHQIPSGYGLEAMDICESLFGYWPCLSRDFKRGNDTGQGFSGEGRYGNPWEGTADYLFGSSNPYGERRDEESYYGGSVYAYERHYLEQPQNRQG